METIVDILRNKGFYTEYERSEKFKDINLVMVYATRKREKAEFFNSDLINPVLTESIFLNDLKQYVSTKLPGYMLPTHYNVITSIPKTINGKIDYNQLKNYLTEKHTASISNNTIDLNSKHVIHIIQTSWSEVLSKNSLAIDDNFFEIGGNSLLAIQLADCISKKLGKAINIIDIFSFPTIEKFSANITKNLPIQTISSLNKASKTTTNKIAIIGMEGIFPKSDSIESFWNNLRLGKNCLSTFTEAELDLINRNEFFIPVAGVIDNPYYFDAEHFKVSPAEAKILDPQQRLLLETCYLNLLNTGMDLTNCKDRIGVFASTDQSKYLELIDETNLTRQDKKLINYNNSRDFVATRIAYKLGLNGPAITINTACSSSLTACVQAANSLLQNECDIAIVCASSLILPEVLPGYFYEPEGILSKDGKCSPFDTGTTGTVPSSAVASIILKRHADALENKDLIIASIHSYSINNDGNDKASFAAPSLSGQKKCLENIYNKLDDEFNCLDFIETHGTGTKIGDAIEMKALSDTLSTARKDKIYIGSVKANIGHTGVASGLCGLIKTALILHKKEIPPQLNFSKWNELCSQAENHFQINSTLVRLKEGTRYAGVSSFGFGGTNVHILLQSENNTSILHKEKFNHDIFKNREMHRHHVNKPLLKKAKNIHFINSASLGNDHSEGYDLFNHINHLDFIKEFLNLIENELDITSIKLEDNFFKLGGDSLIALGVISKLLKRYGATISLDDFYNSENFEQIIVKMLKNNKKGSAICNTLTNIGNRTLILIHPGGGSVYQYDFFKTLPIKNIKIITVENQVLNDVGSNINSIKSMAQHYVSLLDKSLFEDELTLCGWSFGGNIAYEMACILQKESMKPNQTIMFDSWAAYPEKYNNYEEFKNIWFTKLDKSYLFDDDLWKKMLWNRLKMLINYQPTYSNLPIKLYKATEVDLELVITNDPANLWKNITSTVDVVKVNATHQSILEIMQKENLFANFLEK